MLVVQLCMCRTGVLHGRPCTGVWTQWGAVAVLGACHAGTSGHCAVMTWDMVSAWCSCAVLRCALRAAVLDKGQRGVSVCLQPATKQAGWPAARSAHPQLGAPWLHRWAW